MKSLKESKKREYLISIITNYLLTCKSTLEYFKAVADTKQGKLVCNKSLRSIDKAIETIKEYKHIEILDYLYATYVGNNAIIYTVSGQVATSKKLKKYDTDKGIAEFKQLMEEQRKESEEREQKRKESVEALKKAKAMGKKVEMVYDKDTKTAKPMIIEDKESA